MRAVTALMILCLSACGTSPALEQAWDEQDNRGGQQAQLDAQAIMVGMEQARIRAALLARVVSRIALFDGAESTVFDGPLPACCRGHGKRKWEVA